MTTALFAATQIRPCLFAAVLAASGSASLAQVAPQPETFPRPSAAAARASLEPLLRKLDGDLLDSARECAGDAPRDPQMQPGYTATYQVQLETTALFSLSQDISAHCVGGAYPAIAFIGWNFDIAKGEEYNPLHLYRLGSQEDDAIALNPAVRSMLRRALLAQRKRPVIPC